MKSDYLCEHCGRVFVRESTLSSHVCEAKRRWQNRNTPVVMLALEAYQRFYRQCQPSQKIKQWEHFAQSSYYAAFVRFAQYMLDVRCVNTSAFIDHVIKNNIKLDQWASDRVYTAFLLRWTQTEDAWDAIRRSIDTAAEWAQEHNSNLAHYFRYASDYRIQNDLDRGRISAWFVFCSETGQQWLNKLGPEQTEIIWCWIDPEHWQPKLTQNPVADEIRFTLKQAGI